MEKQIITKEEFGKWHMKAKLSKYHEDITPFAKEGREDEFHKLFEPYEVIEMEQNCLLNTGINEMWDLITGVVSGATHIFDNAAATIGVGDSATAAVATQTDLQAATNKTYKAMESGYPTSITQKATFKSSFGSSDANYVWNEWVVKQATSTICLNRKVESLGTKTSGTWTLMSKRLGGFCKKLQLKMGLTRGKLNLIRHANPELNLRQILSKCVETIYPAPFMGDEIVRAW